MIGFSAGGTVVLSTAQTATPESRPDFIAPIYAYVGAVLGQVPANPMPLFMALANDDPIAFGDDDLYRKWRDAKASAEMHIYAKGGLGIS